MPRVSKEAIELKSIREKIDRFYMNQSNSVVQVKIPTNLLKKDLLAIKPLSIIDDSLWLGSVYYIVHSIISRTERRKFKLGNRTKGFVGLKFEYLRDIIGKNTKLIIQTLIDSKVIDCDSSYSIGQQSTGFRLNNTYRKSTSRFVTIANSDLVRRYTAVDKKLFEEQRTRLRGHAYLIKWFLGNTLQIDKASAEEYLRLYIRRMKRNFKSYGLAASEIVEVNTHLDNMLVSCQNVLDNWDNPKPIIDAKGGRLYSPLTSIMSQLRYFTTHKGKDLVYFDIKNSQPFHLLALLSIDFWEKPKKESDLCLHNLNKELEEYIKKEEKSRYNTTIMTLRKDEKTGKHLATKGLVRKQVIRPRFSFLVVNGKLYKFISDELKGKFVKPSGFDPFAEEKLAKHEMIKMMYFNPKERYSESKTYFAAFKKLFPTEASVIELLKSKRYQDFSVLLQKTESRILLGEVCRKIFIKDSSIPMYTIHDGIMTTKEHALAVEQIIRSTYKKLMKVEPDLSIEYMSKQSASSNFDAYVTKKTREIFRDLNKEYKEDKVKLTLEDIKDLLQSRLFSKKQATDLPDVFVTMPFPWDY